MRLLIIEDEPKIAKYLVKGLVNKSYAVDSALNAKDGIKLARANDYDCMVLDLNLPDMDGIEIIKKLRQENNQIPILILTARTTRNNILEGFENGTDDYLCKPFDFEELLYRINSLIKRSTPNKNTEIKVKDILFNSIYRKVYKNSEEVFLNNKELGILEYLLKHRGKTISQEELLEHVWDQEIDTFTETVRTNIKTLRKKIDEDKNIILTIRGRGYVIN